MSDSLLENILIKLILLKLLSKGKGKKRSFKKSFFIFVIETIQKNRCYITKHFKLLGDFEEVLLTYGWFPPICLI